LSDPLVSRIGQALTARELGWAVAGGWAIDLFLRRVTRKHADVDIAVWRDEHEHLRDALPDWRFSIAESGQLRPWPPGTLLAPPLHELHATTADEQSSVEFLLNDRRDGAWLYRRDPAIRLPLADAILRDGPLYFLAPEIVLLYKSKSPRATDEADFRNALPRLSNGSRTWLASALVRADAAHPWLAPLRETEE
jgi:hypothetical protein